MARKNQGGKKEGKSVKQKPNTKAKRPVRKRFKRPSKELLNYRQMFALSSKQRVEIFAILCERVASPKEISEALNEGLSQVSYHVVVLRNCGLIVEDHQIPRRGAVEHFYRAVAPTLIPPKAWDHLPPTMRKGLSASILQHFFEDASTSMEAGTFDEAPGELSWSPLILDVPGVEELGQLARDFLESVMKLQANANKRLLTENGRAAEATSATVFLASFLSARDIKDGTKASATRRR